jgi:hypothetical protein
MERIVIVDINTKNLKVPELKASFSRLPKELQLLEYNISEYSDQDYYCSWEIFEKDWSLLIPLRQFLQQEGLKFRESYGKIFTEEEELSGQLFDFYTCFFRTPQLWGPSGRIEIESLPIIKHNCPCCGKFHTYLLKNPCLSIALPYEGIYPTLFYTESFLWVMHRRLLNALQEQGLTTGLRWYPVEVVNDLNKPDYVGIYSDVNIGGPVAPYGVYPNGEPPCPVCGDGKPTYNFYEVYNHPKTPAHWMWSPYYGPTHLFISREVATWLWQEWLKGKPDRPNYQPSDESLGAWQRERKQWLEEREKLLLIMPPSTENLPQEWNIEDFSLTRYGWYPDEAEQAFLPPQYQLEINQPDDPEAEPVSIPQTPPFLAGTNIPENASTCKIDGEIILSYYASEYDFWGGTLVFIYENNQVVDCRLRLKVDDWDFYLHMEDEDIFNLIKYLKTPMFGGDFVPGKEIELEIRLSPDLLPHLLRHVQTVDEAAAFIVKLSQEKPRHPLIAGENWFCTWVKQYIELEPAGQAWEAIAPWHSTFWHHISVSDLTMGEADSEQFARRLTDKYLQWVEAGNGRTQEDVNKLRSEGTDSNFEAVSLDIQEAVTESDQRITDPSQ